MASAMSTMLSFSAFSPVTERILQEGKHQECLYLLERFLALLAALRYDWRYGAITLSLIIFYNSFKTNSRENLPLI
jgi:hypothetical protein